MAPLRSASAGSNKACSRELLQRATPSKPAAQFLPPEATTNNDRAGKQLIKYRQDRGIASFGFKVVPDLLGCRSVYDGGEGVRGSLLDPADTPEVFNETLSRPWPDPRYREQLTLAVAHLPSFAMIGHGKTVTLVANFLHQVKHGRPPIQHHRLVLLSIDVNDLLALCNGREGL